MQKTVLLACLCAFTGTAFAQPGDWTAVQGLAPGTTVKVRADHNSSTCSLSSVSETALLCSGGSDSRSYPRAEVQRVSLLGHRRATLKGALIGLGTGAAVGAVIGAASTSNTDWFRGSAIAASSAMGMVVGTATGAIIGYHHSSGNVIYTR